MELLHSSVISTLEGQLINWKAPIYKSNQGFYGYGLTGGYATVVDGKLTTIAGDAIEFASVSYDGIMSFSDSDRFIEFEVVETKQSIDSLISKRNEILAQTKAMIQKAEAETNYRMISNYANSPKQSQFKTKKEYQEATIQYSLDLATAYAAYEPIETAARKLASEFDEQVRGFYEN